MSAPRPPDSPAPHTPAAHAGRLVAEAEPRTVTIRPVHGLPEVAPGDDLAALIAGTADLEDGDVVVVSQKVVSKAEGAVVRVPEAVPLREARERLTRDMAARVVVDGPGVLIVRTRHGFVCANAGIDASIAAPGRLVLLPDDPDASAAGIRRRLADAAGVDVAVVVTDTFGRAWRTGQTDVAIGVAGIACIRDERSGVDRAGRPLEVTEIAVVDEIAAAADLVRRKAEGVPVVILRGLEWDRDEDAAATDLVRPTQLDLFLRGRGGLGAALTAPEPLRPLDEEGLQRAYDRVSTVAGGDVRFTIESTGDALVVRPQPARPSPRDDPFHDGTTLGAAAALLYAVLVDAGHAPRLVTAPGPAVLVEHPAPPSDTDTTEPATDSPAPSRSVARP